MKLLTRNGICKNLHLTPYGFEIDYRDGSTLTYLFSSHVYLEKFIGRIEKNRKTINKSLSTRFGINIEYNMLADIKLYSTIEKRGFLIIKGSEEYTCLNTIKLNGESLIMNNWEEL